MSTNLKDVDLPVTVLLCHSRVDEEAAVAQLADLLGEELDALSTITENDSSVQYKSFQRITNRKYSIEEWLLVIPL